MIQKYQGKWNQKAKISWNLHEISKITPGKTLDDEDGKDSWMGFEKTLKLISIDHSSSAKSLNYGVLLLLLMILDFLILMAFNYIYKKHMTLCGPSLYEYLSKTPTSFENERKAP